MSLTALERNSIQAEISSLNAEKDPANFAATKTALFGEIQSEIQTADNSADHVWLQFMLARVDASTLDDDEVDPPPPPSKETMQSLSSAFASSAPDFYELMAELTKMLQDNATLQRQLKLAAQTWMLDLAGAQEATANKSAQSQDDATKTQSGVTIAIALVGLLFSGWGMGTAAKTASRFGPKQAKQEVELNALHAKKNGGQREIQEATENIANLRSQIKTPPADTNRSNLKDQLKSEILKRRNAREHVDHQDALIRAGERKVKDVEAKLRKKTDLVSGLNTAGMNVSQVANSVGPLSAAEKTQQAAEETALTKWIETYAQIASSSAETYNGFVADTTGAIHDTIDQFSRYAGAQAQLSQQTV
ncbi:hypothetical protein [Variovorax sp. KK3]|uniref:hypothetical protein n=1 Tax=Variovorax sp. KK3 TaxID=1855728 RepID=UPI00097C44B8|nr:hypothetical protein [Variovorax sp. KK3]